MWKPPYLDFTRAARLRILSITSANLISQSGSTEEQGNLRLNARSHGLTARLSANAHQSAIMDHSTAIMEEAGAIIDKAAAPPATDSPAAPAPVQSDTADKLEGDNDDEKASNDGDNQRKRKGNFPDSSIRHGSRRGGKQSDGDNKRHKKGDMGRADYL